jgi:hypothetical protein
MPTLDEALSGQGPPLNESLKAGVAAISANAVVNFTLYVRLVLPMDGYVFWVRADQVSPSALFNALKFNAAALNQPGVVTDPAATFSARGSLHWASDSKQEEQESYVANRIVFTAVDEVQDLNAVGPYALYIGEIEGTTIKFAFNARGAFYAQAKLYHYVGTAVYADMLTQLVEDPSGFNSNDVVVSNSLPIWLSMNGTAKTPWAPFANDFVMYPSFLVPTNIPPPFAAVHVSPESTRAIAMAPTLGPTLSHDQLVTERVRVTLWGTRNAQALSFLDFVNAFTLDGDVLGLMNSPVPRDEKRTQVELGTIAQKKVIEFEVNYLQNMARNVARQLVKEAIPTFYFGD